MLERFNEDACRAIFLARYKAENRRQPVVAVEDIVLGILQQTMTVLRDQYQLSFLDLREKIQATLPTSDTTHEGIDLPLSSEAKRSIAEASEKAEIHVTPWFLLWVMYPAINPDVTSILEAHGITRDSLTQKKLV